MMYGAIFLQTMGIYFNEWAVISIDFAGTAEKSFMITLGNNKYLLLALVCRPQIGANPINKNIIFLRKTSKI